MMHDEIFSIATFFNQPAAWKKSVLGAHLFPAEMANMAKQMRYVDVEMPCINVPMQRLDASESFCEVWRGSGQLTQGQRGALQYRYDENVLFGVIELPETLFSAGVDNSPLQQATESAYRQVFTLLNELGYPHLFRCWNYFADINKHAFGLERYRQFNQGRQAAFIAHSRDVLGNAPAASALGTVQGPLALAFMAGREAPLNIENPRQISACKYPDKYGPCSPTFSRASLVNLGPDQLLFVSGTASIVGHATLHGDNVVAQTRETMINIEAVLAEAQRLSGYAFALRDLHYKVYVRNPNDFVQIRDELTRCVGCVLKAIYLQADVCRADLLLEIEATATRPSPSISRERG